MSTRDWKHFKSQRARSLLQRFNENIAIQVISRTCSWMFRRCKQIKKSSLNEKLHNLHKNKTFIFHRPPICATLFVSMRFLERSPFMFAGIRFNCHINEPFYVVFQWMNAKPIKFHCWIVLRNIFLVLSRLSFSCEWIAIKRRQKRCRIDFDFMFTLVAVGYMTMLNKHISSCAIDWFHACLLFTALTNYDNDAH